MGLTTGVGAMTDPNAHVVLGLFLAVVVAAAFAIIGDIRKHRQRVAAAKAADRRREYSIRVQFDEPWAAVYKTYTVTVRGELDDQKRQELVTKIQRREQSYHPPLVLNVEELDQ